MNVRAAHKRLIYAVTIGTAIASGVITPAMGKQEAVAAKRIDPAALRKVGQIDPRFLAYNVESVEVTGGNFWAPYPLPGEAPAKAMEGPHGTGFATGAYRYRKPIDLIGNKRLRMLTKELGPSYMRVSGSWANSVYFQDDDQPARQPPSGYKAVMTRAQWAGVVDFGHAVDAKILTSFATSPGARPNGVWDAHQARQLFAYTKSLGGRIDAVELTNEPNASQIQYKAEDYARDMDTLNRLLKEVSPETKVVGPGSTGEAGFKLFDKPPEAMSTARLLAGAPKPHFDAFSWHFYGSVSERCKSLSGRGGRNQEVTSSQADALTEKWLSAADQGQNFYKGVRDRFAPGASIWITETAQAACGGDRWAATFIDTFRFIDQLGRFARNDVSIVFHNTLAASDYSLIEEDTWLPRPNYWAAVLWRRLVGDVVLDASSGQGDLRVYSQCMRGRPGGVTLIALNLNQTNSAAIVLPVGGSRYSLTAGALTAKSVKLNGRELRLRGDTLPTLGGIAFGKGSVKLTPASVTFLTVPSANNAACK